MYRHSTSDEEAAGGSLLLCTLDGPGAPRQWPGRVLGTLVVLGDFTLRRRERNCLRSGLYILRPYARACARTGCEGAA